MKLIKPANWAFMTPQEHNTMREWNRKFNLANFTKQRPIKK